MKRKFLFLGMALAVASVLGSCEKDEDDEDLHEPTIEITAPTQGAVIALADAATVSINVVFTSEDELHEVEVHLKKLPEDTEVLHFEQHSHEMSYTYSQTVDLSAYPSGTQFELAATTCADHECTSEISKEIVFSLQ